VRPKLSAGRVQSVAVRLIVQRERERMAFVSATYWDLIAALERSGGEKLQAGLISVDDRRVPTGKDFDPSTGKLKNAGFALLGEAAAMALVERLRAEEFRVENVEEKPYTTQPYPPFTTSTLQQEANRKLGFTARRAMQAAQALYENGHITYMRTDSTNLADVAVQTTRDLVASQYGPDYLPATPRIYKSKVKNAQEAHEAIRPAGQPFDFPERLRSQVSDDQFRLYDLIWKRTVACQMTAARGRRVVITIRAGNAVFQVSGKTIDFAGYLRAYVEGSDDPDAELADKETLLPHVDVGELLDCKNLECKSHTTQPPPRFSEAALTRALEEKGIGRPSTYASIIETILARDYVFKKGSALVPTWVAMSVSQLLESHLPNLVDYAFTAQMEDDLDAISRGEAKQVDYLRRFYFGNGTPGLKQNLANKVEEIDAREVCRIALGTPEGSSEPIFVRVGRYGPFIEQGERRASLPEGQAPDELTVSVAVELLDRAKQGDEPLGICPETHKPVYLKTGRFGPYVQRGSSDDDEKPKNASLLKGMDPEQIDLATALRLLSLPRELGNHPDSGEPVIAQNGRYGPYVKCGAETRSLPADLSPLDVVLEQSLLLLAQPKTRGRGRAAKREPLRVFDESPVTGEKVQLLDGRYGPYVTDGATNASLPKDLPVEELTFPRALDLLAERASKAPPKKSRKKATPRKSAAKKRPAKKSAARKEPVKTPVKKSATKKKAAKKKAAKS
jgi:DNA topoisomerase-1